MKTRTFFILIVCSLLWGCTATQDTCFAIIADTHLNSSRPSSVAELTDIIRDINAQKNIDFVILAGDITEFGSDQEIEIAARVLNLFTKPWYILSGNHDSKWSESGCNTFLETFGYEQFSFTHNNITFIGTNSGPNMRMAPALIPRESMVWLDSVLQTLPKKRPVVFINHYPLTEDMSNYRRVLDLLGTINIQLAICGHYHINEAFSADGIPSVKCRTSQARGFEGPGYNLVNIRNKKISFKERIVLPDPDSSFTHPAWYETSFTKKPAVITHQDKQPQKYGEALSHPNLEIIWTILDDSDIGSAAVADTARGMVVFANTKGAVKAVNLEDGSLLWTTHTGGKVYSTPAISNDKVYLGSTNKNVYCLDLVNGDILWTYPTRKSIVASPAVLGNKVYIGGSDSTFRALDATRGNLLWEYTKINGFMESRPYADDTQVVTGSWGNELYSFHPHTGRLQWIWNNKHRGRMYSPAATWPVKAEGKIFITTPERKCYALDARTGHTLWEAEGGRESIGLSADKQQVYVKTMFDSLFAFSTSEREAVSRWRVAGSFDYEIGPSPITVQDGMVFVPTSQGSLFAYQEEDGIPVWNVRLSDGLVNYAQPVGNSRLLVSTMDGYVYLISYKTGELL
ncbi:MAG: PQQ-binding-like beta-propeller repeat protein [Bacteroidales bacterium]|nr:PQQ-binding-like beta-propeller repeat protein [Bacteroidales bacterium]